MKHLFPEKVLPVVTIENIDSAKRLAETYLQAGLNVFEITLRTDATLDAIEAVTTNFPEMNVGVGTILTPDQVQSVMNAGAEFGLAPGLNEKVVETALEKSFPFIPGVMTPSEIEKALSYEYKVLKLFPAKHIDGADYIKSMEGPYAQTGARFIPMGGIDEGNMSEYIACPSVLAVGGSWLAPKNLIKEGKFGEIGERVKRALEIASR